MPGSLFVIIKKGEIVGLRYLW